MTDKQKYTAPAVLDELAVELESQILAASNVEVDQSIEKVETTGQEVGGTIAADQWTSGWE